MAVRDHRPAADAIVGGRPRARLPSGGKPSAGGLVAATADRMSRVRGLQRLNEIAGNRAARSAVVSRQAMPTREGVTLQRLPQFPGCEGIEPEQVSPEVVRTWISGGLPRITRTGAAQQIVLHNETKKAPSVTKPTVKVTVDPSNCARVLGILKHIETSRSGIGSYLTDKHLHQDDRTGKWGYMYSRADKGLPKGVPKDDPGDAGREGHVAYVIWKEVGSEGSAAAINTWDQKMQLTVGKGFGAIKGQLPELMALLLKNPEISQAFLDAGLYFSGTWMAVDLASGGVETGENALKFIVANTTLLNFFIEVGERRFAQEMLDAQWTVFRRHAGNVPPQAMSWSDRAIAIVAHINHGTGSGWNEYLGTEGNLGRILYTFFRRMAGKPEKGGAYISHALLKQPNIITSLRAFGSKFGGGLWEVLESHPNQAFPSDVSTNGEHAGLVFVVQGEAKRGKQVSKSGWVLAPDGAVTLPPVTIEATPAPNWIPPSSDVPFPPE